uniref:Vein beta-barrel domain-containing protein n=1 Tax=Anopheles epiroticus TaxID=199890 RepID=A0A182PWA5_9DIPT
MVVAVAHGGVPLPLPLALPRSQPASRIGSASLPGQQPASRNSEPSAVQTVRRNIANTKVEPSRPLPNQLSNEEVPGTGSSSITDSTNASAVAERSLQQRWAAQMRLKGERRRLHRRRWRTASRNRRDSALLPTTTGHGGARSQVGRPQRRNGTGGSGSSGPRRYCSARDPATLAFEAPIVCEAKVKSMSDRRPIFAATFEILALHKLPAKGRPLRGLTVRLQFNLTTTNECDIFRGKFRERGFVREELELGKVYFLFLKPNMRYTNFTILGQPIRKTKRSEGGVLQGVNPNYGEWHTSIFTIF